MTNPAQNLTTIFCTMLGAVLVLYGLHSKDLAYLSTNQVHVDSKLHVEDSTKLLGELHHNIDKHSLKLLQNESAIQADTRGLRVLKIDLRQFESQALARLKSWLAYLHTKLTMTLKSI